MDDEEKDLRSELRNLGIISEDIRDVNVGYHDGILKILDYQIPK